MSVYEDLLFAPMLITDLFTPHKGKRLVSESRKPGDTPFVGGSGSFNSITGFSNVEPLFPGGWLTLTYNGSVGHARFQPVPFFASDDVIALEPPKKATAGALLVCATIITRECVAKYSYGAKLNLSRLMRQTVMIPVAKDNSGAQVVDWEGMTRLGEELLEDAVTQAHSVRPTEHVDADEELPELRFEPMFITDVFQSMKTSIAWFDRVHLKAGEPAVPYLSQTQSANSVAAIVADQGVGKEPGNCITVTLKTQATFYQPVPFYTAQNFLLFRHPRLNAHSGVALVTIMRRAMEKFSWGYGVSMDRLRRTRIMVPVTTDDGGGQVVDWDGLTSYGRILHARAEQVMSAALV